MFSPLFQYGNEIGTILCISSVLIFCIPFILQKFPLYKDHLIYISGFFAVCIGFLCIFADNAHNDVYRYLWDGQASNMGINVYETIPLETYELLIQNDQLTIEDKELFQKTGFKNYYTTYPPTLQLIFWGNAELFPLFERGLKFIFYLFFIGSIFLVYVLYKNEKTLKQWIPVFFCSPLLLWEGIAAAHSEIVFVFFLLLTLFFWKQKSFFWSGVSVAALTWVKFFPAILGFVFLWDIWRNKHNSMKQKFIYLFVFILGGICSSVLLWVWFIPFDPTHFIDALQLYSSEWRMFPLVFDIFEHTFSLQVAQIIQILGTIGIMLWGIHKKYSIDEQIFWTLLAYLLLSSTIFSWYFLWILPLGIFVLARKKLYILLFGILITPCLQHFFTVWDTEQQIFYYENNGLEWEQKSLFWGGFIVLSFVQYIYSRKTRNNNVSLY